MQATCVFLFLSDAELTLCPDSILYASVRNAKAVTLGRPQEESLA